MKRFLYVFFALVLILSSCSKFKDGEVALAGKYRISEEELFLYVPQDQFAVMGPEDKKAQIEKVCDDYLALSYLEEQGDLDSGDVRWEIGSWKIRQLANMAYDRLIIDKILTPSAEREIYNQLKYELNVSHILIGYNGPRQTNTRTKEEALALALEISEKLNQDNFAEMVDKYSDDPTKSENRGNIGWGKSSSWDPDFERAAYLLAPGEISGPVESAFGYHLIKLNERRELPVDPFEALRPEIREIAFGKWRNRFLLREQAIFDSLTVANPLLYRDSVLQDFIDRYVRLSANVFYSEQFTSFDILDIFEDTLLVGYLGDTPLNREWIYQHLKIMSLQMPPRFESVNSFKGFVEQHRLGAMLYKAALNMSIDRSDEFLNNYRVYLAKKAASLFDKYYVFEQINPGQQMLRDFYEAHKDSLYLNEATVQVREVLVSDSSLAVELLQRAKAGENMADLAEQYSERNIGKKNRGLIPPLRHSQYGEMGIAAFNMMDGELSGPYRLGKHFSIIQREKFIPASYKSLRQISYRLLTDYRSHHLNEKRAEQRDMLRKRYRVEVNPLYIK